MMRHAPLWLAAALWFGFGPTATARQDPDDADRPGQHRAVGRPIGGAREDYLAERRFLIRQERKRRFDAGTALSPEERRAAAYLNKLWSVEVAAYKRNMANSELAFPPADAFFRKKAAIERSPTFGLLRKMPKGGALHIHSSAAGRVRWIIDVATKRPGCYVFWPEDATSSRDHLKGELGFFAPKDVPAGFRPVAEVRAGKKDFDRELLDLLTLGLDDERKPDVWQEFANCFARLGNILSYQPVFADYFADAFETLVADGVDYVELRTGLGTLFDLDGGRWEGERFIAQYLAVRDRVRAKYPDFDLKLIVTSGRFGKAKDQRRDVDDVFPLRAKYPDFVVGYDLVGEEDAGNTTLSYLGVWLRLPALRAKYHVDMPFYFHDGESDWPNDENLFDAYLLRSRRIGHGFNLHLFPYLEHLIIEREIPLEICPISNQVLRYVGDLRLHPANGYMRRGVPCVLSSDDPGIFGYDGLSYDFWEGFMAWKLDLAQLKQLALNSILFSAMTDEEKDRARKVWEAKWAAFIRALEEDRAKRGIAVHEPG
jgi:adenosine deaminase CECR1